MKSERVRGLDGEKFDKMAQKLMPILELARLTEQQVQGDLGSIYTTYGDVIDTFVERVSELANLPEDERPRCVLVHTHMTHCMTGHFRSWLGGAPLTHIFKNLKVKKIINIIDNIHVCREYIWSAGYTLTLQQLLLWRDIEQMTTEILSGIMHGDKPFDLCKLVPVNQSLQAVADILFSPEKYQIYMAFPISKVRDLDRILMDFGECVLSEKRESFDKLNADPEDKRKLKRLCESLCSEQPNNTISQLRDHLIEQNKAFRRFFNKQFIAYDPSMIDELPVLKKGADPNVSENVEIHEIDVWPGVFERDKCFAAGAPALGTVSIPKAEIDGVSITRVSDYNPNWSIIHRQIRSRDFRLIEQAEGLVAFRPTLGGYWSRGVMYEIMHALKLQRPFYVIKDLRDGPLNEGTTLEWEPSRKYWGEWDLSIESERKEAFGVAARYLCDSIQKCRDNT